MPTSRPPMTRVLLVEDDQSDFLYVRSVLKRSKLSPVHLDWASTYAEGVERLTHGAYDVCLLDLGLDGYTGFDLLDSEIGQATRVPVIVLTGSGDREADLQAMERGVFGYLGKDSLNPNILERTVRYAMKHRARLEQLADRASRDPLTGLLNLASFREGFERALERARLEGRELAVMFLDLDGFKAVNDTHGHRAGDTVLTHVSRRLASTVRERDILGRIGGDEFVLVLEDLPSVDQAEAVAAKITARIREAVDYEGTPLSVGVSVGVAVYPRDGADVGALLQRADAAMYSAKREEGGVVRFWEATCR